MLHPFFSANIAINFMCNNHSSRYKLQIVDLRPPANQPAPPFAINYSARKLVNGVHWLNEWNCSQRSVIIYHVCGTVLLINLHENEDTAPHQSEDGKTVLRGHK